MCDDLLHRDGHFARMRLLPRLAVHAQLHREMVRLGNLIGGDDVRPERAERINPLAKAEHAGLHLGALDVPRGNVVENHIPTDKIGRSRRVKMFSRFFHD